MAGIKQENGCPRCVELEARVAAFEAIIANLQAALAKAQKNSANSSKPPSSDIVKPPRKKKKPGRPRKRKIGGQPGHPRNLRTPYTVDELDDHWLWHYTDCPCCGGKLVVAEQPALVLQQVGVARNPRADRTAHQPGTVVFKLPEDVCSYISRGVTTSGIGGTAVDRLGGLFQGSLPYVLLDDS